MRVELCEASISIVAPFETATGSSHWIAWRHAVARAGARLDVRVKPLDHLQFEPESDSSDVAAAQGLELERALRAVRQGCVNVLRAEVEKENFLRFRELSAAALLLACEVEFFVPR